LRPFEVYGLTPREFQNHAKGVGELQKIEQRQEWERARWSTYWIMKAFGNKLQQPQDLFQFDDERMSDEEVEQRKKRVEEIFPKYL
jgi:hypothetical protein